MNEKTRPALPDNYFAPDQARDAPGAGPWPATGRSIGPGRQPAGASPPELATPATADRRPDRHPDAQQPGRGDTVAPAAAGTLRK